ncbi:MAG: cyclic nucleotide-binding domain-containing protein [Eubacteriales bacterium]|nr:cyclic nucleotide-binding domain-containing protein [Eubacteriales bacterium]
MDVLTRALIKKYAAELPSLEGYAVSASRFAAGDVLAAAGDPLTHLCFLVEGCATVYNAMDNGRTALLTEYRGVQTVGEVELLMEYPVFTGSVRASTKGAMLRIPLDTEREKLLVDAAMLRYLSRVVACKLERSSRLAAQDRLYPLASRLAAYLLYTQGDDARLHVTRISELMGASYRHVLRTLRSFEDEGYIDRREGGFRVLNAEAMVKLAGTLRYD